MRVLVEDYIIVRAFIVSDPEISKPGNHRFELGSMLVKKFFVGKLSSTSPSVHTAPRAI